MSAESIRSKRILIGAGCFADAESALRLARFLALDRTAELVGLLVDDSAASQSGYFPGQQIVTPSGKLINAPTGEQFQALLRSDIRAFQQELANVARAASVNWSFSDQARGLGQLFSEREAEWDILLLGHRELHKRTGEVLIIEPSSSSEHMHALAAILSNALRTNVRVLNTIALNTKFLSELSRLNAAVVIVGSGNEPAYSIGQINQILEAARCPLLIVRSPGVLH